MANTIITALTCIAFANTFVWLAWGRFKVVELDRTRRERDESVDELHALRLANAELVVENHRLAAAEVVATLHQRMGGGSWPTM